MPSRRVSPVKTAPLGPNSILPKLCLDYNMNQYKIYMYLPPYSFLEKFRMLKK